MQFTKPKQYPNWRSGPPADPAIAGQLEAIQAARPLKPPPFQFAPRRLSAAATEARRDAERSAAGKLMTRAVVASDSDHDDGEHDNEVLAVVSPRAELRAAPGSNALDARQASRRYREAV